MDQRLTNLFGCTVTNGEPCYVALGNDPHGCGTIANTEAGKAR